jgi:hypothetical protein
MGQLSKEVEQELIAKANRRSFVKNIGLATAAAGVIASTKTADAQSATIADTDILNFALNLEFLEAEFYSYATTGYGVANFGITTSGSGTAGATTGGSQVTFASTRIKRVAFELAADERYHVALLQNTITALGGTPIAKPAINLGALGYGFYTQADFCTLGRNFEEIGVTAYGGAAPLVTNKTVLGYAARILATEAEHVGFLRSLISGNGWETTALDGVDVTVPPFGNQYFSTNSNSITAVRTPGQVLFLAFGGVPNATSGGFFPNGVNGNPALTTASASAAVTDGVTFTITPNEASIPTGGVTTATLTWSQPAGSAVTAVEIHIGSPNGPLFAAGGASGSMVTGNWVSDGLIFYLQNITGNVARTLNNTIATVTFSSYTGS